MSMTFRNPANGYTEKTGGFWSCVWCFLFGPLYLIAAGLWREALVVILLSAFALALGPLGVFVYIIIMTMVAVSVNEWTAKKYLRSGWVVDEDGKGADQPGNG